MKFLKSAPVIAASIGRMIVLPALVIVLVGVL